jgi:hypothetical protein
MPDMTHTCAECLAKDAVCLSWFGPRGFLEVCATCSWEGSSLPTYDLTCKVIEARGSSCLG